MYHLSLLRSITNKKNLNSLHESKKKKLISHEIRFNSRIHLNCETCPTLRHPNRCSKFHFHPNYPRHKVIPRVSPIFFFFFFFTTAIRFLCDPSLGGGRGGFKLSKRNDLSSQQVTLARVNRRKGLATTPPGLERGDVNIARTIRNRW